MFSFIVSFVYQLLVEPFVNTFKYEAAIKDGSYGRRDLPYNKNELSLEVDGLLHEEHYSDTKLGKVYFRTLWNKAKFPTEDEVVCDLIKVHGYGTYGGRFTKPHSFLDQGIRLHIVDLPSHGRSDGVHGYVPNITDISDALDSLKEIVKKNYNPKKLFLMGSSLGGLISLHTLINSGGYDGIVAVSPCIKVHSYISPPRVAVLLGYLFNRFLPQLPVLPCSPKPHSKSYEADKLFFQDPLTYTGPVRLATILMFDCAPPLVLSQLHKIKVPVLVQQGDSDWMVDPHAAQLILNNVSSKDKQLIMYTDGEHDLHNDSTGSQVIEDSIKWILDRCPSDI